MLEESSEKCGTSTYFEVSLPGSHLLSTKLKDIERNR